MNKDVTEVRFSSTVKTRKLLPHFIHLSTFLLLLLRWVNKEPISKISNVFLHMLLGFLPFHNRFPTTVGALHREQLCFTQIFMWSFWKQKSWDTWFITPSCFQVFGSRGHLPLHSLCHSFRYFACLKQRCLWKRITLPKFSPLAIWLQNCRIPHLALKKTTQEPLTKSGGAE